MLAYAGASEDIKNFLGETPADLLYDRSKY